MPQHFFTLFSDYPALSIAGMLTLLSLFWKLAQLYATQAKFQRVMRRYNWRQQENGEEIFINKLLAILPPAFLKSQ